MNSSNPTEYTALPPMLHSSSLHSSSSFDASLNRRLSLRAISGPFPNRKRGPAPSPLPSFFDQETSPTTFTPPDSRAESHEQPHATAQAHHSRSSSRRSASSQSSSLRRTKSTSSSISSSSKPAKPTKPAEKQSVFSRLTVGIEVAFGGHGAPPPKPVNLQRVRVKKVDIPVRPSIDCGIKEENLVSIETPVSIPTPAAPLGDVAAAYSANKPFADRKAAGFHRPRQTSNTSNEIEHPLFTVEEEQSDTPADEFDEMGLARAFTKRLNRSTDGLSSVLRSERKRPQISPPHLVSTTNQFIHVLRDVPGTGSLNFSIPTTPTSETPALTDTSSRSSSDGSPFEPNFGLAPNHLTQYFTSATNKDESVVTTVPVLTPSAPRKSIDNLSTGRVSPPAIPARAPTHSKREHERLARKRSIRSSGGFTGPLPGSHHTSASSTPSEQQNPFGHELAQLDEVAEDFNSLVIDEQLEEDSRIFANGYYKRVDASDYMLEIAELQETLWHD